MADEKENARPKGLLIPFDKLKLLDILDDAAFRQVFRAMASYVKSGAEMEGLEPIEQVAFESMRPFLDENIKTYQRAVIAHREAGRKGGRPKKKEDNQEVQEETKENQMEPNGFSEEPNETNSPLKYKEQSTTDTNVSDITTTTVVVRPEPVDKDLASIANHIQEVFGDFPPSVGYKLKSWLDVFSTEMILLAIDRAAEAGKRNWTYVDGTLRGWKRDGITNPAGVAASDEQWQNRQPTGRGSSPRQPAESTRDQLARVLGNMDKERGFEK